MKENAADNLIREKQKAVSKLMRVIGGHFDATSIHDFRTSVKKLRALLRLLNHDSDAGLAIPGKIKRLYRIAGEIRDTTINIDALKAGGQYPESYIREQETQLVAARHRWHKHYSDKARKKFKGAWKHKDLTLKPGAATLFVSARLASAQAIISNKELNDEELHDIRKLLKDALYTVKLADSLSDAPASEHPLVGAEHLNEVTDAIGTYNDKRLSHENMQQFLRTAEGDAAKTLDHICRRNAALLTKEKAGVMTTVKAFLHHPLQFTRQSSSAGDN